MPQTFNCPNCSAPLDIEDITSSSLRCPYCNTRVIVPEELLRRISDSSKSTFAPVTAVYSSQAEIEQKLASIKATAVAGQKIEAVKLMRQSFDIGLKQALEAVEAMQAGEPVDITQFTENLTPSKAANEGDSGWMLKVIENINSGNKIEAIRLFREMTGAGLKDAKEAVDGMEASLSAEPSVSSLEVNRNLSELQGLQAIRQSDQTKKAGGSCLLTSFIVFIILVTVIPLLIGMASSGGPLAGVWARINPFAAARLTLAFGKEGTGPGYFTDPRFVSVDNNGHIFVGEFSGGRVQVFDEAGRFLAQWIARGEESGDIYLSGMAASREGAVYVVVGSQLYVYDGLTGDLLGRLDHPDGWGFGDVTQAADNSIVAAWYKNRDDIIRFDRDGQITLLVENAIGNVTSDSEMESKIAVDGSGNIYNLAGFNEAVFIFAADGRYVSRFGSEGDAKGQFTSPRAIAVDNLGMVYISDYGGVMVFAGDGRYLRTLAINGAPMGLTFDDQNNLYVVINSQILRYTLK